MRSKAGLERQKLQSELEAQRDKLIQMEDEKKSAIFKLQMDLALVTDKITHAELQRDQNKKELDETEKRLQVALNQLKKQNERGADLGSVKKNSVDKRFSNQIELLKMSSKVRQEEYEESNKKLKEEIKGLKERNFELQDRLSKSEKFMSQEKNLGEEIERLKREREKMVQTHRSELAKETDEAKRKYTELEKRNRELERQNNNFLFSLEKEKAKANMDKEQLSEKVKELEDMLTWEKKKN
jgi:chromosome segregation ATPase